jgi:uncharacterized protein
MMIYLSEIKHKLYLIFFLQFLFIGKSIAQEDCFPVQSSPPLMVEDRANMFSKAQILELENNLRQFQDSTSNQILVLTVESLCGMDKAQFATEIGHKWGVGQKKFDNGIVILIKPKFSKDDIGQVYIAVGYGLEGIIPDAISNRIVRKEMLPFLRKNDYYSAVYNAVVVVKKLATKEISSDEYAYKERNNSDKDTTIFNILTVIIVLLFVLVGRNKGGNNKGGGRRNSSNLWLLPFLMGGNSRGGSTFGSGGFSSGGFSGGFGGFGGGGFGGGGAGGSW